MRHSIFFSTWFALMASGFGCSQDDVRGRTRVTATEDSGGGSDASVTSQQDLGMSLDLTTLPDKGAPDAGETGTDAGMGGALVTYTEQRAMCTRRDPLRVALFGDLHVHTALSFDATIFGTRTIPSDAYSFAQGAPIGLAPMDVNGQPTRQVTLGRPLDFAAVTDHAEFLAETDFCTTPGSPAYNTPRCRTYRRGAMAGGVGSAIAFGSFGQALTQESPERYEELCGADGQRCLVRAAQFWGQIQQAAEDAYDRSAACSFTSFVGYENTATTGGANLHRNIIFRNATVPALPASYYEAPTGELLWQMLRTECNDAPGGCQALTIPHNSNGSKGAMFELAPQLTAQGAQARSRIEPLMEIYQHKGSSECNPMFSADEECRFETASLGSFGANPEPTDFLRGALRAGLDQVSAIGANPLRLGVIASTDTHNSTAGLADETNWPGHVGDSDDKPLEENQISFSPGGLVGVWAVENSRDALFEAMARRETFGTSGPRIMPRFFGGWDMPQGLCERADLVGTGYEKGVSMGGVLGTRPLPQSKPVFVAQALADEIPLHALQVIKIWRDPQDGSPKEEVIDIVTAPGQASVDTRTCMREGQPGKTVLCGQWTDEAFDPQIPTAYYLRVLQDPTCRWNAFMCSKLPVAGRPASCRDEEVATQIKERAWSSPIFFEGT